MKLATVRGHTYLAGLLNEGSVVVDLGAHKGEFSEEINRRYGCQCHMVEALPDLYAQLAETPAMRKYHFALAGSDGPVSLFVSTNPEANSIAVPPGEDIGPIAIVEGVTLASFMARAGLKRIDLLKVDIEGAEIAMLESVKAEILSNIVQISVEFHDFVPGLVEPEQVWAVTERLKESGFYAIKFSRALNTDVLFINQSLGCVGPLTYWYFKYIEKYLRGTLRVIRRAF